MTRALAAADKAAPERAAAVAQDKAARAVRAAAVRAAVRAPAAAVRAPAAAVRAPAAAVRAARSTRTKRHDKRASIISTPCASRSRSRLFSAGKKPSRAWISRRRGTRRTTSLTARGARACIRHAMVQVKTNASAPVPVASRDASTRCGTRKTKPAVPGATRAPMHTIRTARIAISMGNSPATYAAIM